MNDRDELAFWRELAQQLRVDSIRASTPPKSGHPTSSMSAAELMAVLTSKYFRYDFDRPDHPGNDHLIFSKGHASPLLYSMYKACGAISDEELLTFRSFGSRLEGHPTPVLPWVDVATGSLGQGLPIGVGVALATRLEQSPARVWVLCGDSEMAEGSMWEAFEHGAFYDLDNLIAIIDVNRLGQRGQTMHGWDLSSYVRRAEAFGWAAIEIDGHDPEAVDRAYEEALSTRGRPTVIVARTIKGKGVKAVENQENWHGKPLADPDAAIAELDGERNITVDVHKPAAFEPRRFENLPPVLPRYDLGEVVATRKAYGDALVALGKADGAVVALDGEVGNSTFAEEFAKEFPERYFEMFIAEQQLVAAAVGMQVRGWKPFGSTFAAFFTRAYDFVRMAAISRATIKLCGSHAGVSIGEDGPSQMALEDIAAFRAIHGSTVLYPSDANQTAKLVAAMADLEGISFLRTTRAATPVIYDADEAFPIGGSKVLRSSDEDDVTIIGAGITLHEAVKAADTLAEEGINARVIDLYSVKPIDRAALQAAAEATHGRIVTVEDHWAEGGIGEAVLSAFADVDERPHVSVVAVREMPSSGKPMELLAAAGIDAEHIIQAVREVVADARRPAVVSRPPIPTCSPGTSRTTASTSTCSSTTARSSSSNASEPASGAPRTPGAGCSPTATSRARDPAEQKRKDSTMQSWNLNARHENERKGPHQLFSTPGLRVDVIDLARDEEIGDSWYGDRVLVQVLDGSVRITIGEDTTTCDDGTLVALDSGEAHSVRGLEQSRLLLTFTPRPRGHSPGGA